MVIHCFYIPLKENPSTYGIKKDKIMEIFGNIEQLAQFNEQLLKNFEERLSSQLNDSTCIGDIFLNLVNHEF